MAGEERGMKIQRKRSGLAHQNRELPRWRGVCGLKGCVMDGTNDISWRFKLRVGGTGRREVRRRMYPIQGRS